MHQSSRNDASHVCVRESSYYTPVKTSKFAFLKRVYLESQFRSISPVKLEQTLLSAVSECLLNIFTGNSHTGGRLQDLRQNPLKEPAIRNAGFDTSARPYLIMAIFLSNMTLNAHTLTYTTFNLASIITRLGSEPPAN
jgi:hypothetical protein